LPLLSEEYIMLGKVPPDQKAETAATAATATTKLDRNDNKATDGELQ
jgi:hypothetical protein